MVLASSSAVDFHVSIAFSSTFDDLCRIELQVADRGVKIGLPDLT